MMGTGTLQGFWEQLEAVICTEVCEYFERAAVPEVLKAGRH